ncbi:MAG: serine/threonine-protein kinase [Bdellovibrionota bacterium]
MAIEKLGDILLLEQLAVGGMAEIFRAKQYGHGGFEKTVAVKRILSNYSSRAEFKEMFRAEANLSALLQHPNIAQVYSNGQQGEHLFIVMEFVDGKNLRQLLSKTTDKGIPLPLDLICYIICETAKGLDFAHSFVDEKTGTPLGIVHRDVNHQNIMLSYEGAVKVVDFGVAKASDEDRHKTRAGVLKGKISYMSPEQVRGRKLDRRTDVFSLGIVLWELLTGQALFLEDDEIATLEKVRDCHVPPLKDINPEVSDELQLIVTRALEKEPDNRYSSAKELCADLQRYLNRLNPAYFQSDVTEYLKEVFKTEIAEERRMREKTNQEAKAFLIKNPILRGGNSKVFGDVVGVQKTKLSAVADFVDKTVISGPTKVASSTSDFLETKVASQVWPVSSTQTSAPKIAYASTTSASGIYSSSIQEHSSKLIVLLLVVCVGVIYYWFQERERLLFSAYASSKLEAWSPSFRESFIESCAYDPIGKGASNPSAFCGCLSKDVEAAHILSTKFNPNIISESSHAELNLAEFQKYLKTARGYDAVVACERKLSGESNE